MFPGVSHSHSGREKTIIKAMAVIKMLAFLHLCSSEGLLNLKEKATEYNSLTSQDQVENILWIVVHMPSSGALFTRFLPFFKINNFTITAATNQMHVFKNRAHSNTLKLMTDSAKNYIISSTNCVLRASGLFIDWLQAVPEKGNPHILHNIHVTLLSLLQADALSHLTVYRDSQ